MNKKLTEIAYILDRSGSMAQLTEAAISGFNTFLMDQLDTPGDARLSLVLFDDQYQLHANRAPLEDVEPLDTRTFIPRGTTALLDAIGRTIDNIGAKLAKTPEAERPAKVIFAIYTDGYENASTDYSVSKIQQMIQLQTEEYNWEFLFLAANEDAIATAAQYGIQRKNASTIRFSEIGMEAAAASFSRKVKAQRMMNQDLATPEAQLDACADLSAIVEEESGN